MKKEKPKQDKFCRDCANHFDEHNTGYDGTPILCKCKFDNVDHLLNFDYCDKLILINNNF